jgi:hypothetical protein
MSTAFATTPAVRRDRVADKKTPYCDICFRKGLPKSDYTSHFPKSVPGPLGIVTCPTILTSVCNACGQKGHWASEKFCPKLRVKSYSGNTATALATTTVVPVRKNVSFPPKNSFPPLKRSQNGFAALSSLDTDSDSEEVAIEVVPVNATKTVSWSDIASKPAAISPKPDDTLAAGWKQLAPTTVFYSSMADVPAPSMSDSEREKLRLWKERQASGYVPPKRTSWLDDDSSDEEDEPHCNDEEW